MSEINYIQLYKLESVIVGGMKATKLSTLKMTPKFFVDVSARIEYGSGEEDRILDPSEFYETSHYERDVYEFTNYENIRAFEMIYTSDETILGAVIEYGNGKTGLIVANPYPGFFAATPTSTFLSSLSAYNAIPKSFDESGMPFEVGYTETWEANEDKGKITFWYDGNVEEISSSIVNMEYIPIIPVSLKDKFMSSGNLSLFNNQMILVLFNIECLDEFEGDKSEAFRDINGIYAIQLPSNFSTEGTNYNIARFNREFINKLRERLQDLYTASTVIKPIVGAAPAAGQFDMEISMMGTSLPNSGYLYRNIHDTTGTPELNMLRHESGDTITRAIYNKGEIIKWSPVGSEENDFDFTYDGYDSMEYTPPTETEHGKASFYQYIENPACLSGDTLISLPGGYFKRLDEIEVGDYVKVGEDKYEKVIFSDAKDRKLGNKVTVYTFHNGSTLKIIKDHRVYSIKKKKLVHASTLSVGDQILGEGNHILTLVRIREYNQNILHYTLYTEYANTYYANGVKCGNIFGNIKPKWLRKMLLGLYNKLFLQKELKKIYEKSISR